MQNNELMLKIENVSKVYKLGEIGGTTLRDELQRLSAKIRHKEDPTRKIGSKNYNKGERFKALDNISFFAKRGERIGIIGHNGAGKSTLLKLISRVTGPTDGEIFLNGRVASMLEVGTGFHQELTGRENIYINGAILGMTKKEIDAKMEDIIEFSEVRQFIDTPVKRYSSGMYVKLAFSVAAHLDSEILIMDEVLAVGDMAFQNKCLSKMKDVSEQDNRTILYVSHNMNTIRQLCDRVIVLERGRIIYDGNVEDGISIYLGTNKDGSFPTSYNLEHIMRPSKMHGNIAKIVRFDFLDKKNACFGCDEKMRFRIFVESSADFDNVQLLATFFNDSNSIIGTGQSNSKPLVIKKGQISKFDFEFDSTNITAGDYCFNLDIFSINEYGDYCSLDHINPFAKFKIVEKEQNGIRWENRSFGCIRLSDFDLKE